VALVQQLLAFSRRQVLHLADLDLNEVVGDLVKMIQRVIGDHINIAYLPGQDLASLHADRGQIEQILMNLCLNAKDAMPDGGQITISSKNVSFDQNFCRHHTWAKPGSYVQMSIADTGCGMDEKTLGHLYEPFFTTKEVGKGTGLGLATVYGIVKQHGGLIHTYSEIGKGTLFKVYLPQASAKLGAAPPRQIKGQVRQGQETILLAEDAEPVCKLAKKLLEKGGYSVLVARDGQEALRVYAENADRIDMLLLDVVMPGMGGRAVFERIRRERPDIAVLFASGYSGDSIHTGFVLDEGMTLIQKPYDSETLLRNVREVLDNRTEFGFRSGTNGIM
jgi:CheY-like chemotaxis protein